jgi:hypothetical protein
MLLLSKRSPKGGRSMILVVGETYDSLLGLRSLMSEVDAIPSLVLDLPSMKGKIGKEEVIAIMDF